MSGKQQKDRPRAVGRGTEFDIDAAKAASKHFKLLRASIEKLRDRGQKKADTGLREADLAYKVAHVWLDHAEAAIVAGAATENEWRRYAITETAKAFAIGPRRVQQLVSFKRVRKLTAEGNEILAQMRKFDETLDVLKQLQQGRSLLTDPRYRPAVDHLHMALVDNIARTEVNVGAYMLALVIADEARSAAETRASGLEAKEVSEIPFQVRLRVASEELVAINRLDAFAQRRARRNPKSVSAAAWNFRCPLLTRPSTRS
jgi:hypothetical protein